MDTIFIGIPILNRSDLLERCLAAIDHPAEIVVINNNSYDEAFKLALEKLADARRFTVLHQERNLGVAASWNLIVKEGFKRGFEWIFIGSNDTFLNPGSLKAAIDMEKEPDVRLWGLLGLNFFLIHRRTIDDVGWFDENFYPAYKEDQDYDYRCRLAGVRMVQIPGVGGEHIGSATIKSNSHYFRQNENTHFNWNQNHYLMKWGGDAGQERFKTPYNRGDVDHRWWPDPGDSIAARDWDKVYRSVAQPPAVQPQNLVAAEGRFSDVRHLIYHIYPKKGGLWRDNLELLVPKLSLFNGKRIVTIATDESTDDPQDVVKAFEGQVQEFVVQPNHPLHEVGPFVSVLLPAVKDLPGITFYAHGKGSSYGRLDLPFARAWLEKMIHHNLRQDVPRQLDRYEAAGIYRRVMNHAGSGWHYSGTFFWFRNEAIFGRADRNWSDIAMNHHGVESYIGRHVPLDLSVCLYGDNAPDLYVNYW